MIFHIPTLLNEITSVMNLQTNDLVLTGTPSGVGPVHVGEKIEAGLSVKGYTLPESRISLDVTPSAVAYQL